jgi:hypothetical protein
MPSFTGWRSPLALAALTLSILSSAPARGEQPAQARGQAPTPASLSEYKKEALTTIKDMTSNLLYLGVGVFALVGGYLAKDQPTTLKARRFLKGSFAFFGLSLIAGLVVFMNLISQLQGETFNANSGLLLGGSTAQILFIACGSVTFFVFLIKNI